MPNDGVRSRQLRVLDQPLDLRAGEVRVDDQPGALADQRLVALPRGARRSAPRCGGPARRARGGPARRCRVPGDDRLALVGDPDPRQVRGRTAASAERPDRDPAGHLPDLGGVVLDPARPREVLLELAVGATARAGPRSSKTMQVRPRGPLVDRQDHRPRKLSSAYRPPNVAELLAAVQEARRAIVRSPGGGAASSISPLEAGADRVDRHADLQPPAGGEGNQARAASRLASPAARRAAPRRSRH